MSVVPFTVPVQGGHIAPLFCLAVLFKRYDRRIGRQSCLTSEPGMEVVTVPKRCLYKRDSQQDGIMGDTGVTF